MKSTSFVSKEEYIKEQSLFKRTLEGFLTDNQINSESSSYFIQSLNEQITLKPHIQKEMFECIGRDCKAQNTQNNDSELQRNQCETFEDYQKQKQLNDSSDISKDSELQGAENQCQQVEKVLQLGEKLTDSTKELNQNSEKNSAENQQKLTWIRDNIIGFNTRYISQLQIQLQAVYTDHTATNRPFKPVETMLNHAKLYAANPHTQFNRYGKYSTQLMHQAMLILLKCFNANQEDYLAIPAGSGSTGAIEKTIKVLKDIQWAKNADVLLTPYQHHSNILPWIEYYDNINVFEHDSLGIINISKVQEQIRQHLDKGVIISVSAASNVTSQLTDLKTLNNIIGKIRQQGNYKIIFAVDCAAFCCHHQLDLKIYDQIDFAFLSPHKNLGGPQSCGILVAKQSKMDRLKPTFPGGGTVRFVHGYSKDSVMYHLDSFSKQTPGTPPFLGYYRAALSFELLNDIIGYDFIHKRESENTQLFYQLIDQTNKVLKKEESDTIIQIYGQSNLEKKANVVTFNYHYENSYVKHNFVSLLYADLFGIQIRSGCFCSGPFGVTLLQIDRQRIYQIQKQVRGGKMINKPGYLRLDLTFYLEDYEIEYVSAASLIIARHWRKFTSIYTPKDDGSIELHPVFSKKLKDIYSLADLSNAEKILEKQQNMKECKLQNRRKTLQFQLKRAEWICKNVDQFMNKIQSGAKFNLECNSV